MTRVPQTAIQIPVIIVVAHGFCNHITRLVQNERSPNITMSVPTNIGKESGIIIERINTNP
jgi:hypothetical protein